VSLSEAGVLTFRAGTEAQAGEFLTNFTQRLAEEANAREAKHPPNLSVETYNLGTSSAKQT